MAAPSVTLDRERPSPPEDQGPSSTPAHGIRGAKTVLTDFAAMAMGRMAGALLSLVTALMTTRLLGPRGYGTVAFVGVVGTLLFTITSSWTGTSIRRYGREYVDRQERLGPFTWNRAIIGAPLFALSVAVLIGLRLAGALPGHLGWIFIAIAIGTGFVTIITDHWTALLQTFGRIKLSAVSQLASQAFYVVSLVAVLVLGAHIDPVLVLTLALGANALLAAGLAPVLWRRGVRPIRTDRRLLRRMLWLSLPLIGLTLSQYVFSSIDIVVLRAFRGPRDVGLYAVAYQIYTVLSMAAGTITAVFIPLLVSLQLAGRRDLIARYLRHGIAQGLFVVSSIGAVVCPFAPLLFPVVFGSKFGASSAPFLILAVGLVFLFAAYFVSPLLTLHEATRATAAINIVAALTNLVGDVLLVGVLHMGILAPAIATTGSLVLLFLAFHWRGGQLAQLPGVAPVALATPVIAAIIPSFLLHGYASALVGEAVGLACIAAILRWRCPFSPEDAVMLSKLSMPEPMRRVAIKAIELVA